MLLFGIGVFDYYPDDCAVLMKKQSETESPTEKKKMGMTYAEFIKEGRKRYLVGGWCYISKYVIFTNITPLYQKNMRQLLDLQS